MATMSVKLLSMLISLAMMLTGTYGVEAPQEAARTLTLSNVTLTVNGESVTLEPTLSLGAATDGAKALYSLAVHSGDSELFPMQLTVTEEALTALVKNADTAFTVPASAIDAVTGTLAESATASAGDEAGSVAAMLNFYTQEYIPAYTRVLQKAMDPEFSAQMRQKSQALMEEKVDRGEGQPGSVEIDGVEYECMTYHYTLDAAHLMALADAVYTLDEDLAALYDAIFKLYDIMPEESGLKGLTSFADLAEKTGLTMSAEFIESVADEGDVSRVDTVITVDLSAMVATASDSETADLSDAAAIAPIEIYATNTQVGAVYRGTATMEYTLENASINLTANSSQDSEAFAMDMDMAIDAGEEGGMTFVFDVSRTETAKQLQASVDFQDDSAQFTITADAQSAANADDAGKNYSVEITFDNVKPDNARFALTAGGEIQAEGGNHNTIAFTFDGDGVNAGLSFDLDVTTDAIEEAVAGSEPLVIDDLTNLGNLMADEAAQGRVMQAAGSLMTDAGTLTTEASVTRMLEMIQGLYGATETSTGEVSDRSADAESDAEETGDYAEEPEDDGVLPFETPEFAYLPEGWEILETEVNTAYDQVMVSIADKSYDNNLYAIFMAGGTRNESYVMDGAGKLVPAEVHDVQLEKTSETGWVAYVTRGDATAELYFTSETVTLDEIARIVNGLTF